MSHQYSLFYLLLFLFIFLFLLILLFSSYSTFFSLSSKRISQNFYSESYAKITEFSSVHKVVLSEKLLY